MANTQGYLVEQTKLIAIEYNLIRRSIFGNARLGFLGLDIHQAYVSLLPGGLQKGWQPRPMKDPNAGPITRFIDVLMLAPVTVDICQSTVALQIGTIVYKKMGQTPFDGQTPQQWIFEIQYTNEIPITL